MMENGFEIVRDMYDVNAHSILIPSLFEYTKTLKNGNTNDRQTPGAPSFYKDREMSKVQIRILPKMEAATGLKLYPTYNYFRIYNSTSILKPHKDRPACEVSCTLNLGFDGDYNWPVWIKGNDGKDYEVVLEPGDALVYKGCDNLHWREDADNRVICQSQVFIHFVNQQGPFEDCIFDELKLG